MLGKEGFAAWAGIAKPIHDYLALAFTAGLIVMLLKWFHHNIPTAYDREWFKQAGGYFGSSHPPAGFANAGEKAYYWVLVFGGTALVVSGFYLLFPNLGFERAAMQNGEHRPRRERADPDDGRGRLHIYLGTLGSEGALEGMITGEVDEGWARQHHGVWLDEVQQGQRRPAHEAAGTVGGGTDLTGRTIGGMRGAPGAPSLLLVACAAVGEPGRAV